jgi:hypothetical protein
MKGDGQSPTPCIPLGQVLEDEFTAIHGGPPFEHPADSTDDERLRRIYDRIHKLPEKRTALCISDDGIGSATFGPGIIQGLARLGVLDKFNYLSTTSGGSYIGAWLTA